MFSSSNYVFMLDWIVNWLRSNISVDFYITLDSIRKVKLQMFHWVQFGWILYVYWRWCKRILTWIVLCEFFLLYDHTHKPIKKEISGRAVLRRTTDKQSRYGRYKLKKEKWKRKKMNRRFCMGQTATTPYCYWLTNSEKNRRVQF